MKQSQLLAFALSMAFAGAASAQIPGVLKDKAKGAVKELTGDKEKEGDVQKSGGESGTRPAARKDPERKYPPGLSFATVLNGVKLHAKKGKFSLYHIQTTFLPDDCTEGFTVLRRAQGEEVCQWDWKPDRLKAPYALINVVKTTDLRNGQNVAGQLEFKEPGDYVLDMYLPTEHFYSFPFSLRKVGSDDAFGPGDCWVLDGAWQDWGYLYYREAKPDQSLVWKVWLRSNAAEPADVKIRVEIVRDADGQLVCTSRGLVSHSLRPDWVRYEFDMIFPKELEGGGAYFKAKDLLGTDGAHTLTMKINDEVYGAWKFAVEGGKLNYASRTVRGEADPLKFIEGGKDAWWYARE